MIITIRKICYNLLPFSIIFITIFFIQDCAVIKPPSGGPKDTTAPFVINVNPPSGSLYYKSEKIVLEFSEYMDPNSIEKGIRIFPYLEDEISILSKGNLVTIDMPNDLEPNQTYVINLSRNIKDEHGIELSDAIFLAYSTGGDISKGSISGIVYSDIKSSVHLWKIKDYDNIENIFLTNPTYITDVSNKGAFTFQYLSKADYLILSIDRSVAGLPLNTNRMYYGLYWKKIISLQADENLTSINMLVKKEDLQLKLLRGEWSGNSWGRIFFNRPLENLNKDYILNISYSNKVIKSVNSFLDPEDKKSLIFTHPDLLNQPESFKVIIYNLHIEKDAFIDSASLAFSFSNHDTSLITLTSPKSDITITLRGLDQSDYLELKFSKPIPENKKFVYQLYKNDTMEVKKEVINVNPMQVNIIPENNWEPKTNYLLNINDGLLQDSTIKINITTLNYVRYGGLRIPIEGNKDSSICAELSNVENRELKNLSFVNSKQELVFKKIPEGKYIITIFHDRNSDYKYTYGTANPFEPAESFFMKQDTLEIRGNWDIDIPIIDVKELY